MSCSRLPNPVAEREVASFLTVFEQLSEKLTFEALGEEMQEAENVLTLYIFLNPFAENTLLQ
jgi:hypothetical protein